MRNIFGPVGNYGGAQSRPEETRQQTYQTPAPLPQHVALEEPPTAPEPKPEEEGFTTKLRLNIPDHFDVGVDKNVSAKIESNVECWKGTGIGRNDQPETREFKLRPGTVDTDCYFMIIERKGENTALVVPVSHFLTMDPVTAPKTGNTVPEARSRAKESLVDDRLKRFSKAEDAGGADENKGPSEGPSATGKPRERVPNITWDYEGAASDDEELYPEVEHEEHDEDPLNQPHLTLYGHKLKSLLQQQVEREADEELQQYSDDDDGSQVSAPGKQQRSQDAGESQSSKKAKTGGDKSQNIEERLMSYLRQNNGKVPVKGVLAHFNITAKNEDFRLIQSVIQKRCTMSSEDKDNKKIKYIAIKPEYS
ncbi:uncharacterized protein BcabD6B2_58240 [Babesia caballi]|uniref:Transcription initiation factor IIF subunit beta n=1 Tax=Babesia caballi TaxID=5871 RepID=A0AAV4M1Y5_BABCB|nr:hypothetical protein, conserved [Babesia caballi]